MPTTTTPAPPATTRALLTAAELWQLPPGTQRRELRQGVLRETMPPGLLHGDIVMELGARLRTWARENQRGRVVTEAGFILARDPDTVRAPDIAYISTERLPATGLPQGFGDFAPDLAVEIVSPSESATDIRDKISDYLQAGTQLVWVLYPTRREVVAHWPDGTARSLTAAADDTLAQPDLLPGFACPLAALFG